MSNKQQTTTSLIILIATVLLIVGAVVVTKNNNEQNSEKQSSTVTQPTKKVSSTTSQYIEGAYSAVGRYQSPGGNEKIKISLTLQKDGTIVSTNAESEAVSGDGAQFQKMFIRGYKSKVVGKKIGDINISQVSGSSLTPEGFNDALQQIENQARA